MNHITNKRKVINDPVHGFITIPSNLCYDIISHPWFQRLRRIKQLGTTELVYPGALHTRFHHALGCLHLITLALDTLSAKGIEISAQEREACQLAILLHDIGHGPFSHALEHTIIKGVNHEAISLLLMQSLNKEFDGALTLAIKIFTDQYERKFFSQLVSSQLDIDRLDYLTRDSFFSGVEESQIGAGRILKMANVANDTLVFEEKAIYSIENFLNSRRLMYWQVYLHKTSVAAEQMLVNALDRLKNLYFDKQVYIQNPNIKYFLNLKQNQIQSQQYSYQFLNAFTQLDDYDIWAALKTWSHHNDTLLATLAGGFLNRNLLKIKISEQKNDEQDLKQLNAHIVEQMGLTQQEANYLMPYGKITNAAYVGHTKKINILTKSGKIVDIADASDLPNIKAISSEVKKYFVCYPANLKNLDKLGIFAN